jgi:beta-glucosidase
MLKNNGCLPFRTERMADGRGLKAEGPFIKTVALFGEKSYDFLSGGTGSGCVHPPYVVDMVKGLENVGIQSSKTLTDIYLKYIEFAKVKFQAERHPAKWYQMEYFGQQKYPEIGISPICINNEVKAADAAIITIGRQAGEGVDRDIDTEFNLVPEEQALIKDVCNAFHAAGKPVVVIINSGSVIETASWSGYPDAILCAWQPGMEGGNSIADLLTGKVNPSGKLTMTWPIAATDHPSTNNFPGQIDFYSFKEMTAHKTPISGHTYTNHEEDIYVGYRFFDSFDRNVAYPFGYGLSYTTFDISNPQYINNKVRVKVKNTGKQEGTEVVQVYMRNTADKEGPLKTLRAYQRVTLKAGQSKTIEIDFPRERFEGWDVKTNTMRVVPGTYELMVGSSSADNDLKKFNVTIQ